MACVAWDVNIFVVANDIFGRVSHVNSEPQTNENEFPFVSTFSTSSSSNEASSRISKDIFNCHENEHLIAAAIRN